jgi:hypothetical protein
MKAAAHEQYSIVGEILGLPEPYTRMAGHFLHFRMEAKQSCNVLMKAVAHEQYSIVGEVLGSSKLYMRTAGHICILGWKQSN